MKGLLQFSVDAAACSWQEKQNRREKERETRFISSLETEIELKKRCQILLHSQLKMLEEMKLASPY
jgi:hypothetical protein